MLASAMHRGFSCHIVSPVSPPSFRGLVRELSFRVRIGILWRESVALIALPRTERAVHRSPTLDLFGTGRNGVLKFMKLYVGNLPFDISEDDVRQLFEQHGTVHSVALINDRDTGRPRGFGFVEMDDEQANAAMNALNGTDFGGRSLNVNEARERQPRSRGGWSR